MKRNEFLMWVLWPWLLASVACGPQVVAPVDPKVSPRQIAYEQKLRMILLLEDERQLRSSAGDLISLLTDAEARIRRRAALAAGRVKLAEAVGPLTPLLHTDTDVDVRQMAAFAMGLIGDASAAEPLMTALNDADGTTQGRAAEALGMLAHKAAAPAVAAMVKRHLDVNAPGAIARDEHAHPLRPPAEAVRLGVYARVQLGSFDALACAVYDAVRPRSRWWPIAYALQLLLVPCAEPGLLELLDRDRQLKSAYVAPGQGQ